MDQEATSLTLRGDVLGEDRKAARDNVNVQIHKSTAIDWSAAAAARGTEGHLHQPGVRGDTASGRVTKLATLRRLDSRFRLPLFIKEGEKVKVHTETRELPDERRSR